MRDLEWAAKLRQHFGNVRLNEPEWAAVKKALPIGSEVSGKVVATAPFGVWMDIGVRSPALLEGPQIETGSRALTPDGYPLEGEKVVAKVLAFRDDNRQVCLTQRRVPAAWVGPHIETEITFLPTEHGGRTTPVRSGYRPHFYYGGQDWDAAHVYVGTPEVRPGQTAVARLWFPKPEDHAGRVSVGMSFLIREGNRVVGYGRVVRIMEPDASQAGLIA